MTEKSAINSTNLYEEIMKIGGYNGYYKIFLFGEEVNMGNGIFSKFPLSNSKEIYVQRSNGDPEDYTHENRMYLQADARIGDNLLTIGTTHLSYSHKFEMTPDRLTEFDRMFSNIRNYKENFIVAGDFNATPNSSIIKKMNDDFNLASPPLDEKTWTTKPFDYGGFRADTLDWRLDYIFATRDIKVIDTKILQTDTSDHLPILTIFEI